MIKLNNIRLVAMNIVKQVTKPLETVALFIREPVWVKIKKVTFLLIIIKIPRMNHYAMT